jgi:hypothetical protein
MRHTRIAFLLAAATCLLRFATAAIAELWHPSGCLSCARVEVPDPTPGYNQVVVPVTALSRPERYRSHPRRHLAAQ